jgi:hypothetical protein
VYRGRPLLACVLIASSCSNLTQNRIDTFEIRQSDAAIFESDSFIFDATVTQETCEDSSATKLTLDGALLCVISGTQRRAH